MSAWRHHDGVSWVKMLRRLTHDGDYLMIDVTGATPGAQCRRADITTERHE